MNPDSLFMGFGVGSGIVAGVVYLIRSFRTASMHADNETHAMQLDHLRHLLSDEQLAHDGTRKLLTATREDLATAQVELTTLRAELSEHHG